MNTENGKLKPAVKAVLEERAEDFILNEFEGLALDKKTKTNIALLVALREVEGITTGEFDVIEDLLNQHLADSESKYQEAMGEVKQFVEEKYQELTSKRREELAN